MNEELEFEGVASEFFWPFASTARRIHNRRCFPLRGFSHSRVTNYGGEMAEIKRVLNAPVLWLIKPRFKNGVPFGPAFLTSRFPAEEAYPFRSRPLFVDSVSLGFFLHCFLARLLRDVLESLETSDSKTNREFSFPREPTDRSSSRSHS